MAIKLSEQAKSIINYDGHMVLTAPPGCGKTTILSEKICHEHSSNKNFSGIVVSYTVKASKHLHEKCQRLGLSIENSFFGTLDKFCLAEIILRFGNKLTKSKKGIEVISLEKAIDINPCSQVIDFLPNTPAEIYTSVDIVQGLLEAGFSLFENNALTALYILNNSKACKRYITSQYTHIIIDEYQDCSAEQHAIFKKLKELGLTSLAAGDLRQSIFQFAKKDPKYLNSLLNNSEFKHFSLIDNFRSHPSIVRYTENIITELEVSAYPVEECKVVKCYIEGTDLDIPKFIVQELDNENFEFSNSTIGVFAHSNKECGHIASQIENSILIGDSPLNQIEPHIANLFEDILLSLFDKNSNSYSFSENYTNSRETSKRKFIRATFQNAKSIISNGELFGEVVIQLAEFILLEKIEENMKELFLEAINSKNFLYSFTPPQKGTVTVMTYHKSKGLEFDIVFLTSLYEGVFPYTYNLSEKKLNKSIEEAKNLYFVGCSRAKEILYLCTTSHRLSKAGNPHTPGTSRFVNINRGERYMISYENFLQNNAD